MLICIFPTFLSYVNKRNSKLNLWFVLQRNCLCNIMRWPPWSTGSSDNVDDKSRRPVSWADSLNATNWEHFTEPQVLVPTLLMTTGILGTIRIYRSYVRRIPQAKYIKPAYFRKRSLFGVVTRVGDGDNFHLFHTPLGRIAGWGWLRTVPKTGKALSGKTVCSPYHQMNNIYLPVLDPNTSGRG
jgi:hypothetical protein